MGPALPSNGLQPIKQRDQMSKGANPILYNDIMQQTIPDLRNFILVE
jgi:hypothetical protein